MRVFVFVIAKETYNMTNIKHKVIIFHDPETGAQVEKVVAYPIVVKPKRLFIVTHYEWYEIEQLGVTKHFESEDVYYDTIYASSHNEAKSIYFYQFSSNIPYCKIKARLHYNWCK